MTSHGRMMTSRGHKLTVCYGSLVQDFLLWHILILALILIELEFKPSDEKGLPSMAHSYTG